MMAFSLVLPRLQRHFGAAMSPDPIVMAMVWRTPAKSLLIQVSTVTKMASWTFALSRFPYEDCDVNLVPDVCELSLRGRHRRQWHAGRVRLRSDRFGPAAS